MKKKIFIILFLVLGIFALVLGGIFVFDSLNRVSEDNYNAEDYVFENSDQVIEFLSNIYKSDDISIISNEDEVVIIKAVTNDGIVYNYSYNNVDKTLDTIDLENTNDE